MAGELGDIEMLEKLSEREKKRLAELETVVKQDLKAFLRVGAALAEIQQNRLYRQKFLTFKEYMKDVWDLGESHGHRLIGAHAVVERLQNASTSDSSSPIGEFLPQTEAQVRPLVKYKDDPAKLAEIWGQAVQTAPGGKVTAKHVQLTLLNVFGKDTKESTGKRRAAARNDQGVSPAFKSAHEALMQEIEREKLSRYKTSSRKSLINHLDGLRAVVSEEGDEIANSHWGKGDLANLTTAGFTLYRKRLVDLGDKQQWLIEKADSGLAGWQFVANYTHEEQCDGTLERLTSIETALRC